MAILETRPIVVHRSTGYFAVSPAEAAIHIGVEGLSEAEARSGFSDSLLAWAALANC